MRHGGLKKKANNKWDPIDTNEMKGESHAPRT